MADKFADIDGQVEAMVPKLISVMLTTFTEERFAKGLLRFNADSQCKVQYGIDDLF